MFLLIALVTSCDLFKGKEKATNEAVQQELAEIDWNVVDELPSFPQCQGLVGQEAKNCFEKVVTQHMLTHLGSQQFEISKSINDTIFVNMVITSDGEVQLKKIKQSALLQRELPELQEIIKASITKLPKALPAHKRGIPVTAKFVLPIYLNID
ncbi:hypothetical protein [Spongiivirga citrea]|nr:hypothetical protein [Spongiivirga citrea]